MKSVSKPKISNTITKAERSFAMKELGKKLQAGLDSGIGSEINSSFWKGLYKKYNIK